jgi:hypothetical protein
MPDLCHRRFPFHVSTALMTLMKAGADPDRISIMAVGECENYKGEISRQEPAPGSPLDHNTPISLEVGFPSAVDGMPYQFFYGLGGIRASTGDWETRARQLMAAFDAAQIKRLALADLIGMNYNLGALDSGHIGRLLSLFRFDMTEYARSLKEAMLWVALMPTFHFWAGNAACVEKVLSYLFEHEFEIVENVRTEYDIPADLRYHLGNHSEPLGRGTVLGKSFSECDSGYMVVMKGLRAETMRRFLPGKRGRRKLENIIKMCMPGHLNCRLRIVPRPDASCLGRADGSSYLGYTTYA